MKIDYPLVLDTISIGKIELNFYRLQDIDQAVDQLCKMAELYPEKFDYPPEDLCPYYGVLWDSALALIEYLNRIKLAAKPILEIGCGLALPSLYLAKVGHPAAITCMDFHPNVAELFQKNLELNQVQLKYQQCDWTQIKSAMGDYPIIIGSDILYEGRHPKDLAMALLKMSHHTDEIIIADPKRGREKIFYQILSECGFKQTTHEIMIKQNPILIIHFTR
jgi:2-polyprenyl-3-methyl-5-hydroxy-6-metoxy-1,4-benzoquinol methylase